MTGSKRCTAAVDGRDGYDRSGSAAPVRSVIQLPFDQWRRCRRRQRQQYLREPSLVRRRLARFNDRDVTAIVSPPLAVERRQPLLSGLPGQPRDRCAVFERKNADNGHLAVRWGLESLAISGQNSRKSSFIASGTRGGRQNSLDEP